MMPDSNVAQPQHLAIFGLALTSLSRSTLLFLALKDRSGAAATNNMDSACVSFIQGEYSVYLRYRAIPLRYMC